MNISFRASDVADILGGTLEGNGDAEIKGVGRIQDAQNHEIAFLSNPKYEKYIYESQAGAIIVSKKFKPNAPVKGALIRVDDPYSAVSALLEQYKRMTTLGKTGVEEPAFAHESAQIGENVYRGAFSYIGQGCKIGDNVKIFPHAYIGDGVRIGDNTVLYAGVKIYHGVTIGAHCTLQAGCVIGGDGFGYAPQEDGSYKPIPQVGDVVLKDFVDVGANATIDRAAIGSTVLEKGVKIDNLVMVAHNVYIGENTAMASQSGISGSSRLGKNCVVAGQVGIVGHLEIANRVTMGAQAGITKDIKNAGAYVTGSPHMEHRPWLKTMVVQKKLPQMLERIKELENKIQQLSSK